MRVCQRSSRGMAKPSKRRRCTFTATQVPEPPDRDCLSLSFYNQERLHQALDYRTQEEDFPDT